MIVYKRLMVFGLNMVILCRALLLGRVLMRAVAVTLNTFSGSITIKEGLKVTLYILEHRLVEAPDP